MKLNSIETGFMNAGGAQWIPPTTTFALPPSSPATGVVFIFTDALTSGAAVGGGTSLSYCRWSGNAWIAIAGGGGGVGPQGPQGDPGATGPQGPQGEPGISAGRIFYYSTVASDIAGYKTILTSPSANAENTLAVTCNGTADFPLAQFATAPGVPGVVDYPAGTSYRQIYAKVSAGTGRLHWQIYIRSAAGVETLVRDEFSNPFTDQTVALQEWMATSQSGGAMLVTDRLVNKISAQRVTGATNVTVTMYFEGTAHVSQIQTTISAGGVGPTGPQGPQGIQGVQGPQGLQGLPLAIQDEGTPLTQRSFLDFVGTGVTATDDSANNRTVVTIPGGSNLVTSVFGRQGVVVAANGDYSAAQVTNAVSTLGSYGDPAWITSLAYSKLTGTPSSFPPSAHTHAASDVISGVFVVARLGTGTPSASNYLRGDGAWTALPASAVTSVFTRTGAVVAVNGDYTAAQVTNAVSTIGSYADPGWITTLAWSKITGAPATGVSSVFGRSGAVVAAANDYTAAQVTNAVSTLGSYSDPAWITGLAWAKITGAPSVSSYQTPWLSNINASGFNLNSVGGIGIGASALVTYAIYAVLNTATNITALFQNTNAGGASGIVVQNDGSHSGNLLCAGSAYTNPAWRNNTVINSGGTSDSLILATNSIERVTVTAAGLVGIGKIPATYKLEVSGDIDVTGVYRINGVPLSAGGVSSVFTRTGAVVAATGDYTAAQITNAVSVLGSYADPAWITSLAWSKVTGTPSVSSYQTPWLSDIDAATFKLNSLGTLGIGQTASATTPIAITCANSGQSILIQNTSASSGGFAAFRGNFNGFFVGHAGSASISYPPDCSFLYSQTQIVFGTANLERMRITSAGNVGVGNTAAVLPSTDSGVHVIIGSTTSGVTNSNLTLACNNASSFSLNLPFANYARTGTDKRVAQISAQYDGSLDSALLAFFTWNAGVAGERMRITAAGNVGIGTAGPSSKLSFGATDPTVGSRIALYENPGSASFRGIGMANLSAGVYGVGIYASLSAAPTDTNMTIYVQDGGVIKMFLGGSLKTLSVDGSGFVKAA